MERSAREEVESSTAGLSLEPPPPPVERPLIYLKVDIEGGEAALLPKLLVSGALCFVSYLRVEWHLNVLPEEQRLSIVSLKHALRSMLTHACTAEHAEIAASLGSDHGASWHAPSGHSLERYQEQTNTNPHPATMRPPLCAYRGDDNGGHGRFAWLGRRG